LNKESFFSAIAVCCLYATCAFAQTWEGEILDTSRPLVALIDFDRKILYFSTTGNTPWTLEVSSTSKDAMAFSTQIGDSSYKFFGMQKDDVFEGTAVFDGQRHAFIFQRISFPPKPKNRVEAWDQDIDVLETRFFRYDHSFSSAGRAEFLKHLKILRAHIPDLSDQAIEVALARTIALAHNGHTRLYLMRNRTEVRQSPIRVWWFTDGLYIIRADKQHEALLGCRILRVGNMTTMEAFSKVRYIDSGSATWQRYMSSYFLTSPDILFGAGVLSSDSTEDLTISCNGKSSVVTLPSTPLKKSSAPQEAWHDLAPAFLDHDLIPAFQAQTVPLYLQRPNENYWSHYLPAEKVLYVQYNRAQANEQGSSPDEFKRQIEQSLKEKSPRALVFDLRFNTGGNGYLAEPLLHAIAGHAAQTPVFVITGRATFSAGIMAAAELRQWAKAIVVGEPAGDDIDFWAEGGNLTLPNSGLTAHYANGFHHYSAASYPSIVPYVKLTIDTLAPSLPAKSSWSDYMAGKDVAMEAIIHRLQ